MILNSGTILAKMIERCGPDSELPVVMANDALLAGIDTTGNTAGFIMYHLATNPDKQEKLYEEIVKVIIVCCFLRYIMCKKSTKNVTVRPVTSICPS